MHSDAGSHQPPALCALKSRTFLVRRHNRLTCPSERTPWRAKTQEALGRYPASRVTCDCALSALAEARRAAISASSASVSDAGGRAASKSAHCAGSTVFNLASARRSVVAPPRQPPHARRYNPSRHRWASRPVHAGDRRARLPGEYPARVAPRIRSHHSVVATSHHALALIRRIQANQRAASPMPETPDRPRFAPREAGHAPSPVLRS